MFCVLFHCSSFLFPNLVNIPLNLPLTLDKFTVLEAYQTGDSATAETGVLQKAQAFQRDCHEEGVRELQGKEVYFANL